MSINIKSEEAHRLAKELGELKGQSLTVAVTEARRESLHRAKEEAKPPLSQRLMEIGKRCAAELHGNPGLISIDDLYDETGLPK
jgi:antitoxin VapB